MLKYRVNRNNIDKRRVDLPVTSVTFFDFNEKITVGDETVDYEGDNRNKIMVTCECDDIDKIKEGSFVNAQNILYLTYDTYTFDNKFSVIGVNEENRSFSFLIDKYITLSPFLIMRNADLTDEFLAEDMNELKTITLYFNQKHYFDELYNAFNYYVGIDGERVDSIPADKNPDDYTLYQTQEIPIYFNYTIGGVTKTTIINFTYFSSDTLVTNLRQFRKRDENGKITEDYDKEKSALYKLIFGKEIEDDVNEDITGNLGGIKIERDNLLFADSTNYSFQYERPVVNIPLPISNAFNTNLQQYELLQEYFVEDEKKKAINNITDLETDVYYPVIKNPSNNGTYQDVYTIKFNLHFREHRGEKWVADNNAYWNGVENENNMLVVNTDITKNNSSDLLTFLDFTDDDVHYQKNKLKKSFLRLLFYDSTNPGDQNLLFYSTIFLDSGDLFAKYVKYMDEGDYTAINYDKNQAGKYELSENKVGIRVNREHNFVEKKRLSSQFVVRSKNTSIASSEGFYLYIWKSNSDTVPQDLYMKVEFNHAGYGRTIPFMMPYWDKNKWPERRGIKTFGEIVDDWNAKSNFLYVKNTNEDDRITVDYYNNELDANEKKQYHLIEEWKNGNDLVDGHYGVRQYDKFSYIHLKYEYDKDNGKHIYYMDEDTYGNITFNEDEDDKNKCIEINLYEAKVE